ncbi:MAG: AraC family transcriptional regulator, partial [Caldilineae bacterium]
KTDPETDFIPVILLTARAETEDRIEGLREHADDYLTKPFDVTELRVRIDNLIESRRRLRARFGGGDGPVLHPAPVQVAAADAVFLDRVQAVVEAHLGDEDFTVEQLAAELGHSRGHLHRRLRALLDCAPSELLRTMRLERAAALLEARAGNVSEVAYAVGFKSVAHFSNTFLNHFGCRPSAYPEGPQNPV